MDAVFVNNLISRFCLKIGRIVPVSIPQELRTLAFVFNNARDLTPHSGPLSMNLRMWGLISNDLRALTPHPWSLSPLRGEGAASGRLSHLSVVRHHYLLGSWSQCMREFERGLSMNLRMWGLISNDLCDSHPSPFIPLPVERRGSRDRQSSLLAMLHESIQFAGGGHVRMEQETS
jgi:hypothetical protein